MNYISTLKKSQMNIKIYKTVFKNTALLAIGRFFSRIAQFFMFIYAARHLGADKFGIFSFSYNLATMLLVFMDIGISRYTIQQTSRDLKLIPIYLGTSLIVKIFIVTIVYSIVVFSCLLLDIDHDTYMTLIILTAISALDNFTISFSAAFDATENMQYTAMIILISNVIMSAVGLSVILMTNNLFLFCGSVVLGAFLRFSLTLFWYFKKYQKPVLNFNFSFTVKLIKMGFIFALPIMFGQIYNYIDSVMLKIFDESRNVGYYNAAYMIFEAPLFLSGTLVIALFPTISRLYSEKSEELNNIISRLSNIGFALGLFIALAVSFLSEKIIAIYGTGYAPSATVLPILIFSIVFIIPSEICTSAIRAADKQSVCVFVSGGGAITNILLNLILIPKYSFIGAACATLITEILVTAIYVEIARRYIVGPIFKINQIIQSLILSGLLMLFLYSTDHFSIWFQVAGCMILFLPFSLISGLFKLEEIRKIIISN
ncbi:flippase [Desulfobulbus sp. F3]|nr:flippase [Desulfobulbus sp. F3]